MFIIYDLIFLVFAIFYLPVFLFKRKMHAGFAMRLGILPENLNLDRPIWIHAVSVGEAMAIKLLLEGLREIYPAKRFVISTVTPTGNKIAKGIAKENDFVTYLPLDFSFIVRRVLDKINPELFIIAETEIWPNLIYSLYSRNIPIVVVNARMSDVSFGGYSAGKFFLRSLLNKISFFCVQTGRDAGRFSCLGVRDEKIKITGNMKFDAAGALAPEKNYADWRIKLGLANEEKLLVCGSTHPGEEEIILNAYKGLFGEFPQLKLLIAPRHPVRVREVEKISLARGFQPVRISQLSGRTDGRTVFILDTVGQLTSYYGACDMAFVGGSLIKKGGHNILEPAAAGKPVIFGPYMFNFRDIADLFLKNKTAILARNQEELMAAVEYLLNNPAEAAEIGRLAKELVAGSLGATKANIDCIKTIYGGI
jgi:3-deoxy-D-manno-octulosonic-acid transferase